MYYTKLRENEDFLIKWRAMMGNESNRKDSDQMTDKDGCS